MKTTIVVLFLLFIASKSFAQQDSVRVQYCELVGMQKAFSQKLTIYADFGEVKNYWKDSRIKDEQTGKVKTFNSMVDALNYMAKDGWEFVQGYPVSGPNGLVYHWLLKK